MCMFTTANAAAEIQNSGESVVTVSADRAKVSAHKRAAGFGFKIILCSSILLGCVGFWVLGDGCRVCLGAYFVRVTLTVRSLRLVRVT